MFDVLFLWSVIAICAVLALILRGLEMYLFCQDRSEEWQRLYRIEQRLNEIEKKLFNL